MCRRKKANRIACLFLAVAMIVALAGCGEQETDVSPSGDNSETQTIKIAVAAPMTGSLAEYGLGFFYASSLAAEGWNENGGVDVGGVKYNVEVVKYDDAGDTDQAVVVAEEIVSTPDIWCVIGHFASGVCMAAAPTYENAKYINISPSSSQAEFTLNNEYIFRNNTVISVETATGVEMAVEDLGCKNIGVLSIDTEWGLTAGNAMEDNLKEHGITDITRLECASGQSDMATEISKFKAAGVECIMVAGEYDTLAPLALACSNSDYDVYLIGCSNAYTEALIDIAGEAAEGIYAPVSFFAGNPDERIQEYVTKYIDAYGSAPSALTTQAYDSVNIFLEAVERAGVLDREAIKDAMYETDHEGMSGYTTFDAEGDATKEFTKIMVKDGQFVIAEF